MLDFFQISEAIIAEERKWDALMPDWRVESVDPEERREVSEIYIPAEFVSADDWDLFLEILYSDPMEWHECVYQETPDGMGCVACLYT